jgi:4-pyridoxolactonase
MRIWFLDGGSILVPHASLLWNVPGADVRIPCFSVLVEHDDGLVLFDTGFDLEHTRRVLPFEQPEQTAEQTIPAQLALCGFGPTDVTMLVNSHLHFDHVGGNKLVPGAEVVLHARELAQARNHEPFEYFGYSDTTWDRDGLRFSTVAGDAELTRGIRLFETPGHSVGHLSALVGSMLFPFDVVATTRGLEREIQSGFHIDPVAGLRSIRRVKELAAEHGAEIFLSHDPDAWQTYKHAPDFYEVSA